MPSLGHLSTLNTHNTYRSLHQALEGKPAKIETFDYVGTGTGLREKEAAEVWSRAPTSFNSNPMLRFLSNSSPAHSLPPSQPTK